MSERSTCSASFGNVKISDLDFADDAVIFVETFDILLGALKVLIEVSEPLGLWVSWVETKIPSFNDILDAAILSVPVCGEDVEVTERFTYRDSDIHVSAGCEPEVNDSLDHGVCRYRYVCRMTKIQVFRSWCFQSCSLDMRLGL